MKQSLLPALAASLVPITSGAHAAIVLVGSTNIAVPKNPDAVNAADITTLDLSGNDQPIPRIA